MSVIVQAAEAIKVGCPIGNGCMGSIISFHPGATPATEAVHCGECGENYCGYCLLRSAQGGGVIAMEGRQKKGQEGSTLARHIFKCVPRVAEGQRRWWSALQLVIKGAGEASPFLGNEELLQGLSALEKAAQTKTLKELEKAQGNPGQGYTYLEAMAAFIGSLEIRCAGRSEGGERCGVVMVQWSNACAPTFPFSSAVKCLKCGDVVCGHELLQGLPIRASENLQEVLAHSRGENRCALVEGHEKHHGPMARWGTSLLRHLGRKMAEWNTVDRLQPVDELDVHTFGQEVL